MRKNFTFRVPEEKLLKLHHISKLNKRSANAQMEFILDKLIADFEEENGIIPVNLEE